MKLRLFALVVVSGMPLGICTLRAKLPMANRVAKWRSYLQHHPSAVDDSRILLDDPDSGDASQFGANPPLALLVGLDGGLTRTDDPEMIPLVQVLLENGADPNAKNSIGWTPLHYSCHIQTRNEHVVKLLVQYGADLNVTLPDGSTPWDLVKDAGGEAAERIRQLLLDRIDTHEVSK